MGWVLRGLVLVMISVVSGLLWLLIKPDDPTENAGPPPAPQTKYNLVFVGRDEASRGCQNVSTSRIANFFKQRECEHLTRALYTTTLPNGDRVATSVVTVLMPDVASASQLNALTTQDATGNIRDLVDDEHPTAEKEKFPDLDDDAYASQQQDRLVVIGDSAYFSKSTPKKDPAALDVTMDALKLGWPQETSTPR